MNFSSEQEDNEFPTLSSLESLPTKDPQVFSLFNTEDPLPLPPIHKISLNSTVVYSGQRFQTYLPKFRSLESKSRIGSKNQKKIIERKRTDSFFRYEVKRKDKGSNSFTQKLVIGPAIGPVVAFHNMIPSSQSRSASPSSSSSSPSPSPSLTTQTTKQKRKDITSVPKKTISPKKNSRKKKRGIFDPDFSTASENGDGQDEVGDNDVRGDKAKDQADFGWAMFERARLNDDGLVKGSSSRSSITRGKTRGSGNRSGVQKRKNRSTRGQRIRRS